MLNEPKLDESGRELLIWKVSICNKYKQYGCWSEKFIERTNWFIISNTYLLMYERVVTYRWSLLLANPAEIRVAKAKYLPHYTFVFPYTQ